jgi:release factor glutamine methyltransferase
MGRLTGAAPTGRAAARCSRAFPDASAPAGRLLSQTAAAFELMGMPLPGRWARTVVAAVLDVPHAELGSHSSRMLGPEGRRRFKEVFREASPRAPVAYLVGRAPFLGLDFEVSRETLIPKVDTELFLGIVFDELARRPLPPEPRVLELCTGSGCVAVSLAGHLPGATVLATDVSEGALAVARRNVARHNAGDRVELGIGDMWQPVRELAAGRPFDLILSNPPYIPTADIPGMGRHVAEHEPHLALDGGADGLDLHRRILDGAADHLAPGGRLFLEHEWYHGPAARALAGRYVDRLADVRTLRDANGKDRALYARRGGQTGP